MPTNKVKLICETAGCIAENIAIELVTDATQYACGACGQFITNAEVEQDAGTD